MRRGAGLLTMGLVLAFASPAWAAPAKDGSVLLAAKKKKKKKKKKDDDSDFGMESVEAAEDNDSGVGIHREQEGVDTPYVAEAGGATELSMLTTKNDGSTDDSTRVSSDGHILFRFGKVFLGPDIGIGYKTSSSKLTGATTKTDSTSTSLRLGPLMRFFFGNVDTSLNLPFLYAGVAYKMQSDETKAEGAEATKLDLTGYEAKVGGGLAMFLDSNIALVPRVEYYMSSLSGKPKGATEDVETETSGVRLLLELMTFL
jgi:hypothetical protein